MKKLLYLLLFLPLLFTACSDDDDNSIKFYTFGQGAERVKELQSTTMYLNTKMSYASIRGGSGDYTAVSTNQDVLANEGISIEDIFGIDMNTLSLSVKAVGETTLVISDSKGNTSSLKLTVSVARTKFDVHAAAVVTNNEVSETLKTAISEDIAQNNVLVDNSFILTYTSKDAGTVVITSSISTQNKKWEGTFRFENDEGSNYFLILHYNNREHRYRAGARTTPLAKQTSPVSLRLEEDLTEYYQAKYPTGGITDVRYMFDLMVWQSFLL